MENYERDPVEVLEYSDDLACGDVGREMMDFLTARFGELVDAQPVGTEARWATERLRDVTLSDCRHLSDMLTSWEEIVGTGRAERPGLNQVLRQDIGIWWNRIIRTTRRFREHPDFLPRWRYLPYHNAEFERFLKMVAKDHVIRDLEEYDD